MLDSLIRKRGHVIFQGKNNFLTPVHDWIQDCIWDCHLGLELEVGSSLEYEYSVTQFLPGYYIYVKRWDGGPVLRSVPSQEIQTKVINHYLMPKGTSIRFSPSPYFWV